MQSLQVRKHLNEQIAYEEIRHFLSQLFIENPMQFMQDHGRRPEDLSGSYLREFYASTEFIARDSVHSGFNLKFDQGRIFCG